MTFGVQSVVTSGTFSLDGGTWDVDNNIWVIGDENEVVIIDAAHGGKDRGVLQEGPPIDQHGLVHCFSVNPSHEKRQSRFQTPMSRCLSSHTTRMSGCRSSV